MNILSRYFRSLLVPLSLLTMSSAQAQNPLEGELLGGAVISSGSDYAPVYKSAIEIGFLVGNQEVVDVMREGSVMNRFSVVFVAELPGGKVQYNINNGLCEAEAIIDYVRPSSGNPAIPSPVERPVLESLTECMPL